MFDNKDYSSLTHDELLTEEKKIKRHQTFSAGLIGFLIGVMIFGLATKGFGFLHIFLPLVLIGGIAKGSQNLKQKLELIRGEIGAKNG